MADDIGEEMDLKPVYCWFKEYRKSKWTIAKVHDGWIHNCYSTFGDSSLKPLRCTEDWQWGDRIGTPDDQSSNKIKSEREDVERELLSLSDIDDGYCL